MPKHKIILTLRELSITALCKFFHDRVISFFEEGQIYIVVEDPLSFRQYFVNDPFVENQYLCLDSYSIEERGRNFFREFKESYLAYVPYFLHNEIMSSFISFMEKHFTSISIILIHHEPYACMSPIYYIQFFNLVSFLSECLLTPHVARLDLTTLAHLSKMWIIRGTYTNCNFFIKAFSGSLINTEESLESLVVLILPHFVNGNLVRRISRECRSLEHLILVCSTHCRDAGLCHFCALSLFYQSIRDEECENRISSSLRTLVVPEPSPYSITVTNNHYKMLQIFNYFKNLEILVGFPLLSFLWRPEDIVSRPRLINFDHGAYHYFWYKYLAYCSIEEWWTDEHDQMFRHYLQIFSCIKDINLQTCPYANRLVLECFPETKSMTLCTRADLIQNQFLNHADLIPNQFLNHADLIQNQFQNHADLVQNQPYIRPIQFLNHFLDVSNITKLDIFDEFEEGWPMLVSLSTCAPLLEELTLRCSTLGTCFKDQVNFPKLVYLEFVGQRILSGRTFLQITSSCPLLRTMKLLLRIGYHEPYIVLDEDIENFVPNHPCLERFEYKLGIYGYYQVAPVTRRLTMKSLDYLLDQCPNLKVIGSLDSFGLSDEQILGIYHRIRSNNWDLEISMT